MRTEKIKEFRTGAQVVAGMVMILLVTVCGAPASAHSPDTPVEDTQASQILRWVPTIWRDQLISIWSTHTEQISRHSSQMTSPTSQPKISETPSPKPPAEPMEASPSPSLSSPTSFPLSVEQWRPLVEAFFSPSDVTWALRVISCESNGDPNADNPRSTASGLFQHLATYWGERSTKAGWGGSSIWDPEANIAVAAWLYYNGGPGHWVCK